MKIKAIVDQLQHETKVLRGEEARTITYASEHTFPDERAASEAFGRSIGKLLNVNGWSGLSSFTADFVLHDSTGDPKPSGPPQVGDFIQVILPGPLPENWVRVTHTSTDEKRVDFTVQPSHDPRGTNPAAIEHFFNQKARSTFRVALAGNVIKAFEIGTNEEINNQEPQAGERAVINTVLAEGGWLFYQKLQWKLLTDYLVL